MPADSDTLKPRDRYFTRLLALSLGLWAAVVALWLMAALQRPTPAGLSRVAVLAALGASLTLAVRFFLLQWGKGPGRERALLFLLPGLFAISLAVRLIGLDFEVEGRYYLDEGTYYHHATEINAGKPLRLSFVYPHLMYYLDALALWLGALFPKALAAGAGLYGVSEPLAISWLLLRGVVALLSALTVVPVFFLARRLAGPWAGALGGLLLAFQPLYNEGSHLNTCDVPSAFFAAACVALSARLLDRETAWRYVAAGVAAGLAAAAKYPAGVVAVAIAAVWLAGMLENRRWSWGLLWAGLAAMAAFVAVMPSLLVYPEAAFLGSRGMLFGARQYGQGGWLGVTPDSNLAFYASHLAASFGWPILAGGLAGLLTLSRPKRRELLALLAFPLLYLVLIAAMSMVVKRNLYPALPPLAAFLGVGWVAGAAWLSGLRGKRGFLTLLLPAATLVALSLPVRQTVAQAVSLSSAGTRELAAEWIREHLPKGASILKESYTPDFAAGEFAVRHTRFAGRVPVEEMRQRYDYLLLASAAYVRFLDPAALTKPHQVEIARRYQEVFASFPEVASWQPGSIHQGPVLRLFRIPPDLAACQPEAALTSADAFVPEEGMRAGPRWPVRFERSEQWAVWSTCLPPGSYGVRLDGTVAPGSRVRWVEVSGRVLGEEEVSGAAAEAGPFPLTTTARVLVYAEMEKGSRLRGITVAPLAR